MIIRNNEWKPKYLNPIDFKAKHKVSADEFNALFNLSRIQGNNNAKAIEDILAEILVLWKAVTKKYDWSMIQNRPFGEEAIDEIIYEGEIDYNLLSDGSSSGYLILDENLKLNHTYVFILDGFEYECTLQTNHYRTDDGVINVAAIGNLALSPHVGDGNDWVYDWEDNGLPFYYESPISKTDYKNIFIIKDGITRKYPLTIKQRNTIINVLAEKYLPAIFLHLTGGELTGDLQVGEDILLWAESGKIRAKEYNLCTKSESGIVSSPILRRGEDDENIIGDDRYPLIFKGSEQRPKYNADELVLLSELNEKYFPNSGGKITGNTKIGDFIILDPNTGNTTSKRFLLKTNSGGSANAVVTRGNNDEIVFGLSTFPLMLKGSEDNPTYNGNKVVLEGDIEAKLEEWVITLADGKTITKKVYVG